jgi:hypothetical protein
VAIRYHEFSSGFAFKLAVISSTIASVAGGYGRAGYVGFAAMTVAELLAERDVALFMWPIIIPALVPPLIITFCFWALLPSMCITVPAGVAAGTAWGATLILCISILPMVQIRHLAIE